MLASESTLQKSRATAAKRTLTTRAPALGFLVADASRRLIFANRDAITILTYPGPTSRNLADVFDKEVRPALFNAQGSSINANGHPVMKLKSGRRTYFCWAFSLNNDGKGSNRTATLLMLERAKSGSFTLSEVSQQFHLTHREQEAVKLLLHGLSNKEIAEMMGVSANTVKAFLRMVTVRMGVSNRSGIITKILGVLVSSNNSEVTDPSAVGRIVRKQDWNIGSNDLEG